MHNLRAMLLPAGLMSVDFDDACDSSSEVVVHGCDFSGLVLFTLTSSITFAILFEAFQFLFLSMH